MDEIKYVWVCTFCGRPDAECMEDEGICERFRITESVNWGNGPSHKLKKNEFEESKEQVFKEYTEMFRRLSEQ